MMKIISSSNFNFNNLLTAVFVPGFLLLSACGGGSGEVENVQIAANEAPSVNAGQDQSAMTNDNVGINASASDSDGTVESYSWSQTGGASVNLVNPNTANASFVAPATNGETDLRLTFQITATDDNGASATDSVTIIVNQPASNTPPTVNAGEDQSVAENTQVNITASASDTDGTVQSYSWTQTAGTNVDLQNSNSANASFTAPSTNNQGSIQLTFQITATDDNGASATDSVTITVSQPASNIPPTVNAGQDQSVEENTQVNITASASDADGTVQSYSWTQTAGTNVDLQNSNSANLSFTAPSTNNQGSIQLTFQITVTDNAGDSASDSVTITITEASSNIPPSVDAGQAQTVQEGDNVSLQASASDEDGTIESYSWSQLIGTNVNLNSANSATASFTAPTVADGQQQSELVFQILVTDNSGATSTSSVSITVLAPQENQAPTVDAGSDTTVYEQTNVELVATASDSDGTISSYSWIQKSGNQVSINNANNAQADFDTPLLADPEVPETYVFEVTVTDDQALTATDSITIIVQSEGSAEGCTLTISPGMQFTDAFAQLSAGDTLCLNDGTYVQAMDIPSNINVRAVNDGKAEIDGQSQLGEEWSGALLQMKGDNSSVTGLRVHHARENSDTCMMAGSNHTMRLMSCSHAGGHKHKIPLKMSGSGHLVEDSWFYGKGRYVVQCFTGRNITIRRNVARWDVTTLDTESEPNAAFVIYNCSDITIENNISLDYAYSLQDMRYGGDFYSPQNCNVWPEGNNDNHYLGNYAVNHAAGNSNRKGIRLEADCTSKDNVIKDFYVRGSDYGIVVGSKETGLTLENCTLLDIAISSGSCGGSATLGAKYVDKVKISEDLFPWPNEAMIKQDMCRSDERQSEWCLSDKTLSDYVLDL